MKQQSCLQAGEVAENSEEEEADENSRNGDVFKEDTWKSAFQSGGSMEADSTDGREDRIILFEQQAKRTRVCVSNQKPAI